MVASGAVYGWGSNSEGQLAGLERGAEHSLPAKLELPRLAEDDAVVRLACGHAHVLALTRLGHVLAWGRNENGQVGHGDAASEIALFDGVAHKAVAVACGAEHSFVLTELGRLFGFGRCGKGRKMI